MAQNSGTLDIVIINPGDRKQIYQSLGADFSAVEPPYWAAAVAAILRNKGFEVAIVDSNAENFTPEETATAVAKLDPLLAFVLVYGSQPSASTQNMTVASKICDALKSVNIGNVSIGGLHPSALPERTLKETSADFVVEGEGPFTLIKLLENLKAGISDHKNVGGLWYRLSEGIASNSRAPLMSDIDSLMTVAAWDLLPMGKYKAHNWHCFNDLESRNAYAAIYTSFGCPFSCEFCCINTPFGKPGVRFRKPASVVEEIRILVEEYGVKNIKIIDELFVLNERHYKTILEMLIPYKYNINIWAYARVDTVKKQNLDLLKQAGVNWLALGIESANASVRDGAAKQMKVKDIKQVVLDIQASGICVMGNYIFGLPDETQATMQETLDMAVDLNTEFVNMYCAMAYPGSRLYDSAVKENWPLPTSWQAFSQHSYDMLPLPTKHIGAKEVVAFRDNAFRAYFKGEKYLSMVEQKFGPSVREHIEQMTSIRLKRKILGD